MRLRCGSGANARLATLAPAAGLGEIEDGLIAAHGGRIVYAGPARRGARRSRRRDHRLRGPLDHARA